MTTAMVYYQPIQKYVRLGVNIEYVFVVKHNISLCYVNPADVISFESYRAGCCGQKVYPAFSSASEMQIRMWNGAER